MKYNLVTKSLMVSPILLTAILGRMEMDSMAQMSPQIPLILSQSTSPMLMTPEQIACPGIGNQP